MSDHDGAMTSETRRLSGRRRPPPEPALTAWRRTGLGAPRIRFGLVRAVDASFKWQPSVHDNLDAYLEEGAAGQPAAARAWVHSWVAVVGVQPHSYATLSAVAATALALGLIVGALSNPAYPGGILLSLGIWSTAEGFGGPYRPGSVDIGAAIIHVLAFVALFLTSAGFHVGLDRYLTPRLGRWGLLAAGPLESPRERADAGGMPEPARARGEGVKRDG